MSKRYSSNMANYQDALQNVVKKTQNDVDIVQQALDYCTQVAKDE